MLFLVLSSLFPQIGYLMMLGHKAQEKPGRGLGLFPIALFFTAAEYAFKQSYLIFCQPSLTVASENIVFGSLNFVAYFKQ